MAKQNSGTSLPLDSDVRLGVDLGGTKVEVVALRGQAEILWRQRAKTPQGDYRSTLAVIDKLLQRCARELSLSSDLPVGVGTPGALRLDGRGMKNCNSTCLLDKPLLTDLQALLRRPVRLANDADCFTLAEARIGAAAGAPCVFGVILGTGVGGGIVINGQLLSGCNRIAGEWGHNPLPPRLNEPAEHRICYCGRVDCIETYLSGPGMSETYRRHTGVGLNPEDILSRADKGEVAATHVWVNYQQDLARALAQVVNILDPEVIVLGGGLSNIETLYQRLPKLWRPHVFSDEVNTRLCRAQWGDSAGVLGAAWLWP